MALLVVGRGEGGHVVVIVRIYIHAHDNVGIRLNMYKHITESKEGKMGLEYTPLLHRFNGSANKRKLKYMRFQLCQT